VPHEPPINRLNCRPVFDENMNLIAVTCETPYAPPLPDPPSPEDSFAVDPIVEGESCPIRQKP
jgi:hypothetical protein